MPEYFSLKCYLHICRFYVRNSALRLQPNILNSIYYSICYSLKNIIRLTSNANSSIATCHSHERIFEKSFGHMHKNSQCGKPAKICLALTNSRQSFKKYLLLLGEDHKSKMY